MEDHESEPPLFLRRHSKQSVCIPPTVRTDAGVLERRQAQRRWSGREQDGVASEHNGEYSARGTITLAVPFFPIALKPA